MKNSGLFIALLLGAICGIAVASNVSISQNNTVSCGANQTYCHGTARCMFSNETCPSQNHTLCGANQTFCHGAGRCLSFNESCPSQNHTVCGANQTFCHGAGRCLSFNESCPSQNHTVCGANQTFCHGAGRCLSFNESCPSKNHNVSCAANQTFCPATGRCMFGNETCCPLDHYKCHSLGRCIPFHDPCPYEAPSDPCPQNVDPCKEELATSGFLCNGRFSICEAIVTGNSSLITERVSAVSQMACRERNNSYFCPLSGLCHPSGTPCTLDSVSSNNNNSVPNNSSVPSNHSNFRSPPWGMPCPGGKSFCGLTMRCEDDCSARRIYEWIINGNKTYGPYGQICNATTKFCFATMSCIDKNATCQYVPRTPHGNPGNNSVNGSSDSNKSHINQLCPQHDAFCLARLKCVPGGSQCNAFPALNFTGVNGTGTGWLQACKISNPLCERKKYGIDKCFPALSQCLVTKNVTKYRCFAPRFAYCNLTRRCINASEHCCPPGEEFCPESNRCIRRGENCKWDACKNSPCGRTLEMAEMCGKLNEVCPIIVNAPRNLTSYLTSMQPNGTIPNCNPGQTFCFFSGQCQAEPCGINLDDNGMSPLSPWGESCPGNQSFCRFTMSCMSRSKTCTMRVLYDWMRAGNTSVSPYGMVCAAGQKFCLASYSCIPRNDNCTIPIPVAMNATHNVSTTDIFCGPYREFCPKTFACVKKGDPCRDPPTLNYTGASDNGAGFLLLCQLRKVHCPRTLYGVFKCGASKNFTDCLKPRCRNGYFSCYGKCVPVGSPCSRCRVGETFCSKTDRCIRSSDYCLGPGECPPYQTFCPILGGCINNTSPCLPPQSKIVFKTVWYFEELQSVTPSLFPSGNTIAITSISNKDGSLVYHNGAAWVPVSGISPSTALVLGKTSRIKFVPRDPTFHGVVRLNYTVISGTVGTKIDASSSAREADDVIVIVFVPQDIPPVLSAKDVPCEVKEDSRVNIIALEDKLNITIHNTSKESNIPDDILPFLKRATAQFYLETLKKTRATRFHIAVVHLENNPRIGSFKNASDVSRGRPIITDIRRHFNFVPTLNYHGPFNASFAGAMLVKYPISNTIKELQFSPHVATIINVLLFDKNASLNVVNAYNSLLGDLGSKKLAPSRANVISSVDALIAKGANVQGLNGLKTLFIEAFQKAAAENSGVEAPPRRYAPFPVSLPSGEQFFVQYSDTTITLRCKVIPINDAPILTSYITFFPPIPYNLTTSPYNGFNVSEITTRIPIPYGSTPSKFSKPKAFIEDIDGDVPGIAIVFAKNSSLGAYYYKTPGSSWQLINLNTTLTNGKPVGRSEVLLLKPHSSLKFQMHDPNALWSNTEGREQANLLLAAWDQSDNQTDGLHEFFFPTDNNASISRKYASAFTARFGCDNKPGSRGRIDACGRCGGDGRWCRGCDGVAFSGAVLDHCGNCTGGTTNRTFNFFKDCGGGCGTSFRDDCGVCQKYGKIRNFKDCNGTCFGTAKNNSCGYCVLGNTGKPADFGQDLCGVCGGSNLTCLDCAGNPRGTKQIDICGNCLEPTFNGFNAQCVKLGKLSPISGRHDSPTRVKVVGAGLQSYSTATCQFVNASGSVQLTGVPISNKQFTITTVNIAAGTYQLRCQLDSQSTYYYTMNNFTFYDSSAISYSSITPNETEVNTGPINVTIAGSGFPDTGYLRCISNKKFSSPALYVDSSTVMCLFPNALKSADLKVAVSFGKGDENVHPSAPGFQFFVTSPYPSSVSFSPNLQSLIVIMNKASQHSGDSCSGVFSGASISTFGSRSKCKLRTPFRMFISLRGRPTISPGDTVTFINGSLTAKFEEVTKPASGNLNLAVQGPPNAVVPKARLSGPNKIGSCAKLRIDGSASSGGGGRRLTFIWNITWADDQDMGQITAPATQDMTALQSAFQSYDSFTPRLSLPNSHLKIGLKYQITLTVRNFLGQVSENVSLVVVRENKQLPILNAGPATRKIKASRGVTIQARARLSPCLDPNAVANNVLFNWEIDAVGIDLKVTNKPRLTIKKGTLQGGRQYTLTVTASMASDQTLSSTKTIVLDVESGALRPRIRGGSYRVVGANSILTLDGSRSFDPDASSETEWYKWECTDASGDPCFVPDPSDSSRKIRMILPTEAKITLDVGAKLIANNRYTFTMTYNKGARKAAKSVVIKVEPGSPPDVEIKPQVNTKENPTSNIIIKAVAKSTMPTNNVTVECVQEDGFGYIDLTASGVALTPLSFVFQKRSGKSKVTKNFALVIAANTLENGVKYKFRATASHADSSAAGETIITTNAAPSQGILTVLPVNGTAMDTLFTFTAGEGWSDDADDLPLKYQFGYFKKGSSGKEVLLGMFGESDEVSSVKLPPGDESNNYTLTVFVDCKDALGAVTRQTATTRVEPKVIDTAFLNSAKDDILKSFESADWNSAIGNMGALLSSLSSSGSSDSSQASAVTAMKEAFADNTLDILQNGGVTDDPAAKSVMYESMGSITAGGSAMSANTKKNIKDTILGIETGGSSSKRRRRRDVSSSSSIQVYTVSQAETTISLVSNLIDPVLYDSSTMSTKTSVLFLAYSSGIKVCAGLALGMPAAVVKDKLLVIRSEKNSLATADTVYIDMACNDCPSSLQNSAKVKLGSTLQTTYSSWSCAADTTCSGVCLITSQQIYDLLSSAPNNRTLTNVVDFKLYNPETYAAISISTLANPVTYQLPVLENATFSNETYFQCKRWDSVTSSWTASGCITNPTAINGANSTKYIECSCTEVSYLAAFQVDSLPTTAPTTVATTAPAPITANPPKSLTRRARFALIGDYDTLVTPAKEAQFKADVRTSIATAMNVNESRIVNMTLSKGSIIVMFSYIPGPTDTDASMNAAITSLKTVVNNGNFSVTLSDGTVLKADPTSFYWTSGDTEPTTPAPEAGTAKSGLTETEIIIISVVCGVSMVIILIIIVVVCYKKKNKESKVSPESSRAELRDNDVEMKDRHKNDGNFNEVVEI